jgi:hypothetical protein
LDRAPKSVRVRRAPVEHPYGTLKAWMGATHFKTRALEKVRTEMSLHVLAYNLKRVIAILSRPTPDGGHAGGRASKAHASQQVRRNPTIGNRQPASHPPITHLRFYTASLYSVPEIVELIVIKTHLSREFGLNA